MTRGRVENLKKDVWQLANQVRLPFTKMFPFTKVIQKKDEKLKSARPIIAKL